MGFPYCTQDQIRTIWGFRGMCFEGDTLLFPGHTQCVGRALAADLLATQLKEMFRIDSDGPAHVLKTIAMPLLHIHALVG